MKAKEFEELSRIYADKAHEYCMQDPENRGFILSAPFSGGQRMLSMYGTGGSLAQALLGVTKDEDFSPALELWEVSR